MSIRLRPNLISNVSLALASFFIASVIWLIAKEGDLEEKVVGLPIRYETPAHAQIKLSHGDISVSFLLPVSQISRINSSTCWIEIHPDYSDANDWPAPDYRYQKDFRLSADMVVFRDSPDSIQVLSMTPSSIKIEGRLHVREARVIARIEGEPAEGYVAGEPEVEIDRVTLTGAQPLLDSLPTDENGEAYVETQAVDLSDRDDYFSIPAALLLPDGVDVAPGGERQANVIVAIEEEIGQRTISNVQIAYEPFSRAVKAEIRPPQADVTVEGPVRLIADLGAEDFSILPLDPPDEEPGFVADLLLQAQFHESISQSGRERMRILDINPNTVSVRMVGLATPTPTAAPPTPTLKPLILPPIATATPTWSPTPAATPTPEAPEQEPAPPRISPLDIDRSTSPPLSINLPPPIFAPIPGPL